MKILYAATLIVAGSDLLFLHGGGMAAVSRRVSKGLRTVWSALRR